MDNTLAQALEPDWASVDHLNANYKPVLEMVRELIGVVPNCNPVLEIWPTGFRTFNLLVANLLNLPGALVGQGPPKDLVGIAMYASSSAAQCPYCTAHHCSFAIRRGADPEAVLGDRSPVEEAVADLAEAMAVVPSAVTAAHIAAVERYLSPEDVEWIVLAVSLGGYLNKVMDSLGIQLEDEALQDVQALLRPKGWRPGKHLWETELMEGLEQEGQTLSATHRAETESEWANPAWAEIDTSDSIPVDGVRTYLRVFRQAPGAARLAKQWTRGVSGRIGPTLLMLEEEIGYAFPVLATLRAHRPVKAIAAALRDNLDQETSTIGLEIKLLAGLVYAGEVRSDLLSSELMVLIDLLVPDASPVNLAAVRRFAAAPVAESVVPNGLSAKEAAALLLAKAASPSPSKVSEYTVATVLPVLESAEIIEIVTWLALLQTLNRLYSYSETKYLIDLDEPAGPERPRPDTVPYDAELDDHGLDDDELRVAG